MYLFPKLLLAVFLSCGIAVAPRVKPQRHFQSTYTISPELGGKCRWEDFKIGSVLGKGGHGVVKQAMHKASGRIVALKIFKKPEDEDPQDLAREEAIQHTLEHPMIAKHYCSMVGELQDEVVFVLEYVNGQSLRSILQDENLCLKQKIDTRSIVSQLVDALVYLKQRKVVFGDLSSGNLLLTPDNQVKLVDFGAALKVTANGEQEPAPVFVNYKTRPHRWLNYAADWYGLGLLTLEILAATTVSPGHCRWRDQRVLHKRSCMSVLGIKQRVACDLIEHMVVAKNWKDIWGQTAETVQLVRNHPWLYENL